MSLNFEKIKRFLNYQILLARIQMKVIPRLFSCIWKDVKMLRKKIFQLIFLGPININIIHYKNYLILKKWHVSLSMGCPKSNHFIEDNMRKKLHPRKIVRGSKTKLFCASISFNVTCVQKNTLIIIY